MARNVLFVNPPVLAVDLYQVGLYAEAIPFGLLQIATHLGEQGDRVSFLDMMEYPNGDFGAALAPARLWGRKPVGDARSTTSRDVFLCGKPLAWLDARLEQVPAPDEIFVTCCISFNYEPAHAVVRRLRARFPKALLRFGGSYPSLFPEHAARAGADVVHQGHYEAAVRVLPRLDLLEQKPNVWIFRLVLGCKYRCSYCINAQRPVEVVGEPEQTAAELLRIHQRWGVREFSNWDPNVMLRADVLGAFLDRLIERDAPVELKLEMGVQPDLLTAPMAEKMLRAKVTGMTIPFESAEPSMMKRFGKPYAMQASMDAVAMCRQLGFDTRRKFHCTWVVGIRGESLRHVFRTYFAILKAGGLPTPFPLSPCPGTREYELHREALGDKDLADLNGHLWPTFESAEQVALYRQVFEIINQPDPTRAAALAGALPAAAAEAFARELAWYQQGPHQPGAPVD